MLLHQAGKKIVRTGVAELVGGFQVLAQAANDGLVIEELAPTRMRGDRELLRYGAGYALSTL